MYRLLVSTVAACFVLTKPVNAELYFGEIIHAEKKVGGFIYEYDGKNYIPIPVYNSLGFVRQAPVTDIPDCGLCVALEDFSEVQKNGLNIQIFPFADFQEQENRLSLSNIRNELTGTAQQTWAFWTNYTSTIGNATQLSLDNNLSTPWGTLNAQTISNDVKALDVTNAQFIHENIDNNYEIVFGDISTAGLSWGGNYELLGIGYFTTDPFQQDRIGLARDLAIDIEQYTELEVRANGKTIYKGYQGVGQFYIENIYYGGLVDIEILKDSETAESYQFYFGQYALPKGKTNTNIAFGKLNRGKFRSDFALASDIKHGITDNVWLSSAFLASENHYIAGVYSGFQSQYGDVQGGYSSSKLGDQIEFGYQFIKDNLQFRFTHIKDRLLDTMLDRTITSAALGISFDRVNLSARYQKRPGQKLISLSAFSRIGDLSINANLQKSDEETSFNLFFNYRIGSSTFTNLSMSENDHRASIQSSHSLNNTDLRYSFSQSEQNGGLIQLSATNNYLSVNGRSNLKRNDNNLTLLGSMVYSGHNVIFSSQRAQSVGIISADGGDIIVAESSASKRHVQDGSSTAVMLRQYQDNKIYVSPKEVTMSIDNPDIQISTGRTGAYKYAIGFSSPGARILYKDGIKGDVLVVDGKKFEFYERVGFFVKGLSVGKYIAKITRQDHIICTVTINISTNYSEHQPICNP